MTTLAEYEGEKIRIVATTGHTYFGMGTDFFPKEENEDGQESLVVQLVPSMEWMEFPADQIKEISIIS
ncbi:MAG: hypothetical protein PHO44_08020 [Sphaerochaetaceae bacterium]|nr:hypothetical protein [Sphaerochaetaceae bacterium]MDD4007912.1 hypothetical protein [Sphaerochaetaceae bacterium]MDD4396952.1 hypothetical protein [Sphaerochaetaceae bacterium]